VSAIKLKHVIGAIVAAGIVWLTLYLASINTGIVQDILRMISAAVVGLAISTIAASVYKIELKRLLLILFWLIPGLVAVVFIILYYRNANFVPAPIASNLIADFKGSKGTGALTAFGLPFSMMSDSSQNMGSKVWYERVHDDPQTGGFLRVYYQILPMQGREGYVGLYADFSPPPAKPVSLSKYHGVSFRMRINQEMGKHPEVRFVLYSENVKSTEYAYPIARVQPDNQWRDYDIPFNKFVSPPHAFNAVHLDPGRVFRFAFVLVGDAEIHGHVDIDEIKLF